MKRTAVYRMYDANGALLYVGCSSNPFRRAHQHTAQSDWAHQVASINVEWHDEPGEALSCERAAIEQEKPAFNRRFLKRDARKRRVSPQKRGRGVDNSELLAEISKCLAATGETRTAFGARVANDYSLIARLETGTDVRASTREKILSAVQESVAGSGAAA